MFGGGRRPRRKANAAKAWATVAAAAAVLTLPVAAPRVDAQTPGPVARTTAVQADSCRPDGLYFGGTLELAVPAGAEVLHRYRVHRGSTSASLGDRRTPVPVAAASSLPYNDEQFFGGAWTAGLPFTYEQVTEVVVGGTVAYRQTIAATCTTAGADASVVVTEDQPGPTTSSTTGPTTSATTSGPGNTNTNTNTNNGAGGTTASIVAVPRFTG